MPLCASLTWDTYSTCTYLRSCFVTRPSTLFEKYAHNAAFVINLMFRYLSLWVALLYPATYRLPIRPIFASGGGGIISIAAGFLIIMPRWESWYTSVCWFLIARVTMARL